MFNSIVEKKRFLTLHICTHPCTGVCKLVTTFGHFIFYYLRLLYNYYRHFDKLIDLY